MGCNTWWPCDLRRCPSPWGCGGVFWLGFGPQYGMKWRGAHGEWSGMVRTDQATCGSWKGRIWANLGSLVMVSVSCTLSETMIQELKPPLKRDPCESPLCSYSVDLTSFSSSLPPSPVMEYLYDNFTSLHISSNAFSLQGFQCNQGSVVGFFLPHYVHVHSINSVEFTVAPLGAD